MQSVGEVIKKYRLKKNLTQEELGKELFVTKQAVSKWENGRTLPDIETIRTLTERLSIPHEELLGKTITQAKKYRTGVRILIPVTILGLLLALFFAFGGAEIISRRFQSGVCMVIVSENDTVVPSDRYHIEGPADLKDGKDGYWFGIGYGEVRGTLILSSGEEIEFGFINTNNWHNIQICLRIDGAAAQKRVVQTVTYKTEGGVIAVIESESVFDGNGKASVFYGGV